MPWSTPCADAVGFSRASALAYKDGQSRKYEEASWIRWLARDGRIGVDAAHARRARLRVDRAGVFLDVPGGPDGALRREGERSARGRDEREGTRFDGRRYFLSGRRLHER